MISSISRSAAAQPQQQLRQQQHKSRVAAASASASASAPLLPLSPRSAAPRVPPGCANAGGCVSAAGRRRSVVASAAPAATAAPSAPSSSSASPASLPAITTLTSWLFAEEAAGRIDPDLAVIVASIATASKQISSLVARAALTGLTGGVAARNASGDEQKKVRGQGGGGGRMAFCRGALCAAVFLCVHGGVGRPIRPNPHPPKQPNIQPKTQNTTQKSKQKLDIIANDIFTASVANCGRTSITVSEEDEHPVLVDVAAGGKYIVTSDPIDGSSNLDAAISSGTIFGIYTPGECVIDEADGADAVLEKCTLNVRKAGTELAGAGYVLYSSSTVLVLTLGAGVHSFTLDRGIGEFVLTDSNLKIPDGDGAQRIFSGNLGNISLWDDDLRAYVEEELLATTAAGEGGQKKKKPYSYRYVGALVADGHRTLLYGGTWLYPPDLVAKKGKARLLYEVAPMAMIAEQAGGLACVGDCADERVLDVVPSSVHEKSPLFMGSKSEIEKLQRFLRARKGR